MKLNWKFQQDLGGGASGQKRYVEGYGYFKEHRIDEKEENDLSIYLSLFLSFFVFLFPVSGIYNIIDCHVLKSLDGTSAGFSIGCDINYHALK